MATEDTRLKLGGSDFIRITDPLGLTADCTPNNELITTEKIRLVGTIFDGGTLYTNFWTKSESTGTVAQTGSELVMTSGTSNAHYAKVYSVRRARWVTGTSNKYRAQMRMSDTGTTGLTRRWGVGWGGTMPTITDGAYFKLVGTILSVATMSNTTETSVTSFNGVMGTDYKPTLTSMNTYEILYTLGSVYFFINGNLLHKATYSSTHWTSGTTTFHVFADMVNTDTTTAKTMTFRMMNISRLGYAETSPQYKIISGNAATYTLKYGAGRLHKIMYGNTTGTSIAIYDAVSAAGTPFTVTTAAGAIGEWDFGWDFYTGLTMVTTGNDLSALVIYE